MIGVNAKNSLKLGGITLMIIPHSQKKIIKFRINLQWFYFVSFFLLMVCGLSAAAIYWNQKASVEKNKKESEMTVWSKKRWIVSRNEGLISDQVRNFMEYGNSFYYQIWEKPYNDSFKDEDRALNSADFKELMLPLEKVLQFVIRREENFSNLPLGWPVKQGSITSDFGDRVSPFGFTTDFHTGTDFANTIGTPIYATADGEVTFAGNSYSGYGNYVKILHKHGFTTLYGHASKVLVIEHQQVKRGDVIALIGRTGSATGPHVHYEVREQGIDEAGYPYELFLNPLPFFKENW